MQWFAFRLLRDTRSSAIAERPARRCSSAHAKYSVSHHMIIKQFLLRFASFGNQTIPSTRPVAAIQISTVGVINSCRRRSKSLYDTLWRPVHTSNIVEATFDFVATNGNNVERFYCKISPFRQCRNKLNMFNLFRLCRNDEISFDIVAETGNIVARNGNNVEATFDIVERIV